MDVQACLDIPPVQAEYTPKGRWETIAGLKTYVVGPETASKAIIDIYDVFGLRAQTLQGADRLSEHTSALVLVPDVFEGQASQDEWHPADTPEKQEAVKKFREEAANIERCLAKLLKVRKELGEKWPGVDEHVGVFGLCFGGKVGVLASGADNQGPGRKFTVSGTAHPGRLDAKDAEALTNPHICLASPGEPADVVAQYKEILSQPGKVGYVETYGTMFHGWMGGRANLKNEENTKEYERGYKQIAEFFLKYL